MSRFETQSWITILGQPDAELCSRLSGAVESKLQAGLFNRDNLEYIEKVDFMPVDGALTVPAKRLERLRTLCQLWDVPLQSGSITSHRKVIGPVIVAAKRLAYPVVRAFLKNTLHQQRSFNAAAIALLAELSEEIERLKNR